MESERLGELAATAAQRDIVRYSDFLEIPQQKAALAAAGHEGIGCTVWGGYPEAERKIARFAPSWIETEADWPFVRLRCTWNAKYASLGHRDVLGAILALGIAREKTGDICMGDDFAQVFLRKDIAPYVIGSLESAGRATLTVSYEAEDAPVPLPKGTTMRTTVQSMRLDAIVAACCNISRAAAQELLRRGLVKRNHEETMKCDAQTARGDVLSVRGYGRWRIEEEQGETRKGRLGVLLFRFGEQRGK
ncbi:MAG: RNA-binding protein [Christensenellales bacterium]|jgi:RNA-binding protein YlmH